MKNQQNKSAEQAPCTCHPSEAPQPCQHRYALGECKLAAQLSTTREQLEANHVAINFALAHVAELRDAWERGSIVERDRLGGTRSNRNVDVQIALQKVANKDESRGFSFTESERNIALIGELFTTRKQLQLAFEEERRCGNKALLAMMRERDELREIAGELAAALEDIVRDGSVSYRDRVKNVARSALAKAKAAGILPHTKP